MWQLWAENLTSLAGDSGWYGAGLLGLLLSWLLLKHLPDMLKQMADKDRAFIQAQADKDDKHAKTIEDLRLAHAKTLSDVHDKYGKSVQTMTEHCRDEVKLERAQSDRHHQEVMELIHDIHRSAREGVHATRNLGQSLITRQRLADAMQSAEVPNWTKSLDGTLMSWNRACERLFGWEAGETVGRSVYEKLIPPDRRDEEQGVLLRIARGETVDPYETVRLSKAGRRVTVMVTTSPLRDQSGKVVGATTFVHPDHVSH